MQQKDQNQPLTNQLKGIIHSQKNRIDEQTTIL